MPKIYNVIRKTSGGRHMWVETDVGIIRKPIPNNLVISDKPTEIPTRKEQVEVLKESWFRRLLNRIRTFIRKAKITIGRKPCLTN